AHPHSYLMIAVVQCRESEERTFGRDRGADPNSPDRQFHFLLFASRKILALDLIAIDAAQFRGGLQYRGNGIVSGDFPEVYDGRPHPLAVDFGAVSLFTNVALCLRKFLDEFRFDIVGGELSRQIDDPASVLNAFDRLDSRKLIEAPAAARVHEHAVPLPLDKLERSDPIGSVQLTSGAGAEE